MDSLASIQTSLHYGIFQ